MLSCIKHVTVFAIIYLASHPRIYVSGDCSALPLTMTSSKFFEFFLTAGTAPPDNSSNWIYGTYSSSLIYTARTDDFASSKQTYMCNYATVDIQTGNILYTYTRSVVAQYYCAQAKMSAEGTALLTSQIVTNALVTDPVNCTALFTSGCYSGNIGNPNPCSTQWQPASTLTSGGALTIPPQFTPATCPLSGSYQLAVRSSLNDECVGVTSSTAVFSGTTLTLNACSIGPSTSTTFKNRHILQEQLTCLGSVSGNVLNSDESSTTVLLLMSADNFTTYCAKMSTDPNKTSLAIDYSSAVRPSCGQFIPTYAAGTPVLYLTLNPVTTQPPANQPTSTMTTGALTTTGAALTTTGAALTTTGAALTTTGAALTTTGAALTTTFPATSSPSSSASTSTASSTTTTTSQASPTSSSTTVSSTSTTTTITPSSSTTASSSTTTSSASSSTTTSSASSSTTSSASSASSTTPASTTTPRNCIGYSCPSPLMCFIGSDGNPYCGCASGYIVVNTSMSASSGGGYSVTCQPDPSGTMILAIIIVLTTVFGLAALTVGLCLCCCRAGAAAVVARPLSVVKQAPRHIEYVDTVSTAAPPVFNVTIHPAVGVAPVSHYETVRVLGRSVGGGTLGVGTGGAYALRYSNNYMEPSMGVGGGIGGSYMMVNSTIPLK